jgi:hypothetical protein
MFNEEEKRLTRQIESIEASAAASLQEVQRRSVLADQFERVAALLREMDTDAIWAEASERERKLLVNEIIESVIVYTDRLQVAINGAPPLTVALAEVGLREPVGTRPAVSKGRTTDSHTGHRFSGIGQPRPIRGPSDFGCTSDGRRRIATDHRPVAYWELFPELSPEWPSSWTRAAKMSSSWPSWHSARGSAGQVVTPGRRVSDQLG